MPRNLIHNMEIEILGRRINLLDIDLTVTGVQELISRIMKVWKHYSIFSQSFIISILHISVQNLVLKRQF